MRKCVALGWLLVVCAVVSGSRSYAEPTAAAVRTTFVVPESVEALTAWLRSHRVQVIQSLGWQIVGTSQDGGTMRLQRDTPKGPIDVTLQEQRSKTDAASLYTLTLVQCAAGGVVRYRVEVTFTATQGGCRVHVLGSVAVDNPRIRYREVVTAISISLRRFERALQFRPTL